MRPRVVILVDDEGMRLFCQKKTNTSDFSKGDNVSGIIESVELKGNKPQIIMSELLRSFRKII
jgi:N utilization substance protein A